MTSKRMVHKNWPKWVFAGGLAGTRGETPQTRFHFLSRGRFWLLCQAGGSRVSGVSMWLGCHFSRDDFLGIFRFFYFDRLPSKLAMNLVVPSFSLMCIFLLAFWPSSAQSLVLSACEALSLLVLGSQEERLPCSSRSLDVTKNSWQTHLIQCQGGYQCWTWSLLTAGLGFSLRWKIFQKVAMEVVGFSVDFCGGFLVAKCKRKIRKKNPSAKNNKSAEGQGLLRILPDSTFSEKRSFWKEGPKITKIRHTTLPTLAAQQCGGIWCDPPPLSMSYRQEGVSQRYLRDTTWKQGKVGAIPPLAILSRKGIVRYSEKI